MPVCTELNVVCTTILVQGGHRRHGGCRHVAAHDAYGHLGSPARHGADKLFDSAYSEASSGEMTAIERQMPASRYNS